MPGLLPDGYDCKTCGKRNPFNTRVYANWERAVKITCPYCRMLHSICLGVAVAIHNPAEDTDDVCEATG